PKCKDPITRCIAFESPAGILTLALARAVMTVVRRANVVVSPATIGTNIHGARAVQKCQLSGIVPPKIPARHVDRRTREKSIRWSKIRTRSATGLRKHFKNRSRRDQSLRAVRIRKGMPLEGAGAWGNAPVSGYLYVSGALPQAPVGCCERS